MVNPCMRKHGNHLGVIQNALSVLSLSIISIALCMVLLIRFPVVLSFMVSMKVMLAHLQQSLTIKSSISCDEWPHFNSLCSKEKYIVPQMLLAEMGWNASHSSQRTKSNI